MALITLDAFMSQLGEAGKVGKDVEAHALLRVAELVAKRAKKDFGLDVDDAQYILKDFVSDMDKKGAADATGKDRFVESYISTIAKDRDEEAVLPEAVILDDYRELPTVLFGHQYGELGMGMNQWIVTNNNDKTAIELTHSLLAKTIFASKRANPKADQVYQWSIEGMPIGDSIGFIPVKWVEPNDKGWGKIYDGWVKRASAFLISIGREATSDLLEGLKRIYTKVIMLEYSKVMIPSNPFAVSLAVEKGLLLESQAEVYTVKEVGADQETQVLTEQDIEDTAKALASESNNQPELPITIGDVLEYHEKLSADDGARYLDIEEEAFIRDAVKRGYVLLDTKWNPDEETEAKEGRRFSGKTLAVMKVAHDALGSLLETTEIETDAVDEAETKDIDDLDVADKEPEPDDEITPEMAEWLLAEDDKEKDAGIVTAAEKLLAAQGLFV